MNCDETPSFLLNRFNRNFWILCIGNCWLNLNMLSPVNLRAKLRSFWVRRETSQFSGYLIVLWICWFLCFAGCLLKLWTPSFAGISCLEFLWLIFFWRKKNLWIFVVDLRGFLFISDEWVKFWIYSRVLSDLLLDWMEISLIFWDTAFPFEWFLESERLLAMGRYRWANFLVSKRRLGTYSISDHKTFWHIFGFLYWSILSSGFLLGPSDPIFLAICRIVF